MAKPVGLIGLGLMGTVFAGRLRAAGFDVCGYDIEASKREALRERGGDPAGSIAAVGRSCDPVVLAVFSTDQVEEVVSGDAGLVTAVQSRTSPLTVLCTSTCDPDRIAALAERMASRGIALVDAPVSGTSAQVARGDGLGLTGGDKAIVDAAAPVLDALCPRRVHIGSCGDAGRAKLAVNLILGLNRLALAEGLVFASRLGLDEAAFLEVAKASAAYSQIMDVKGGMMVRRDYAPQGRIVQTLKDVHLMLDQAREHGQMLPMAKLHAEILEACVALGEGDRDNCAVIEEIRRRVL
jgi:3-hydroxyisobutyrate dehydrogenase-like beta-hydroxyacid dehydrogenase